MDKIIIKYKKEILRMKDTGITTERSYYYPLKTFLKEIAEKHSKKHKDIIVVIEPKGQWFGKPDFKILNDNKKLIGIIEAKLPGDDLIKMETKPQIMSYRQQIPNFMFTNFYDFRLYNHRYNSIKYSNINDDNIIELLTTFLSKIVPENYNDIKLTKKQREKQKKCGYVDIQRNGKTIRLSKPKPKVKSKPKLKPNRNYVIKGKILTKKQINHFRIHGWIEITRNEKRYIVKK